MFRITETASVLALAGACAAMGAQVIAQEAATPDPVIETQSSDEILSEELIGISVRARRADGSEQEVGAIQSLLFDKDGALTGVLVEMGGFLGFGGKQVALSYDALQVREADGAPVAALVDLTPEELETAPTFVTRAEIELERERERLRREAERQQQQPTGGATQ